MRFQYTSVPLTCAVCAKTFIVKASRAQTARFCSRTCKGEFQRQVRSPITLSEDGLTAFVPLHAHDRKTVKAHALVDAADADWVNQWRWALDPRRYAYRRERIEDSPDGRKRFAPVFLHRELLGLKRGDPREGDHINRDKLDNRRANLRAIPKFGNRQNLSPRRISTSKFRGVHWAVLQQKWRARIRVDGKSMHLGLFETEEEAGAAARAARLQYMPYAAD